MLICKGSPMFLKTQYGSGYHLTVTRDKAAAAAAGDAPGLLRFIRRYLPR